MCGVGFSQVLDDLGGLHHRGVLIIRGTLLDSFSIAMLLSLLMLTFKFASVKAVIELPTQSLKDMDVFDPLLLALVILFSGRSTRTLRR